MSISNAVEEAHGVGCLFSMQWKRPMVWDVFKKKTETRMTATVLSANVLPILHLPCLLTFLCHFHITNIH